MKCAGLAILLATVFQFKHTGNSPDPHSSTSSLMTAGTYKFSRNPMYLGTAVCQLGIAIAVGSFWALGSVGVSLLLVRFLAIAPEETYLEDKFGDEYHAFRTSVRRWI